MDPTTTGAATVVAAQTMTPLPALDLSLFFTQGPLITVIGVMLWWIVRREDWWSQQLAAERSLNASLQERRVEDQKVLIPLAHSMVTSTEQSNELVKRALVDK